MSGLKEQLNEDIKAAMRSQEKERLMTLRMISAAIKQKEVDDRIEVDDTQVLAIIDKLARQHRDSIQQFEDAGRTDLVDKEKAELEIVQTYLPEQLSDDEVGKLIEAAIETGEAESMKDMGKVMGILKPQIQGRTDMANVGTMVKSKLS